MMKRLFCWRALVYLLIGVVLGLWRQYRPEDGWWIVGVLTAFCAVELWVVRHPANRNHAVRVHEKRG